MKQTIALLDFAEALDVSMLEAIGLIDQLGELEKQGKCLEDVSEPFIEMFIRDKVRVDKDKLINEYRLYQDQNKRILARDRKRKQRQG